MLANKSRPDVSIGDMPALVVACDHNHTEVVKLLLSAPHTSTAWIDTQSSSGDTALHLAAYRGSVDSVHALLAARADVGVTNAQGQPPLHCTQSADVARALLEEGAKDVPCRYGMNALVRACLCSNVPLLEVLLEHGGDPCGPSQTRSPLAEAATEGLLQVMTALLGARADVNRCVAGQTALMEAARAGEVEAVKLLLEAGADPRLSDTHGRPALAHAHLDEVEVVRLLLDAAPDTVNQRDRLGRTPLATLCRRRGALEAVEELFRYNDGGVTVDVNNKDINGDTALRFAMYAGSPDVVALLLAKGAEVLGSGYKCTTALMKPFLDLYLLDDLSEAEDDLMGEEEADADCRACVELLLEHLRKVEGAKGEPEARRTRKLLK
jgi:ankyrin repeat protein